MTADHNRQAPTFPPGEPEAPVAGERPAPAPEPTAQPDRGRDSLEPEDASGVAGAPEPQGTAAPAGEPEPDDHEAKVKRDLEELGAKAEKADEYLDLAQRTQADFENYRKRAM